MRIKSAVFNNLYSFGQGVVLALPVEGESVNILVVGKNNDESGADSNGAGKSNILNACFWILFGEVFQEEMADSIIRKGEKQCSGELELIDPKGHTLKIIRGRGTKKFLRLEVDGVDRTATTDSETQKLILQHLNIPVQAKASEYINDFINTVYFSSDVVKGFMGKKTTSKDRFALVERFLALKRYSVASDLAKTKKNELLSKASLINENLARQQSQLAGIGLDQLQTQEQGIQVRIQILTADIQETESTLSKYEQVDELRKALGKKQQVLDSTRNTYVTYLQQLETEYQTNETRQKKLVTDQEEYAKLAQAVAAHATLATEASAKKQDADKQLSDIQVLESEINGQLGALASQANGLRIQISSHYTCPSCASHLMLVGDKLQPVNMEALSAALAEADTKKSVLTTRLVENTDRKAKLRATSSQQDSVINGYQVNLQTLNRMTKPEVLATEIERLKIRNTEILALHTTKSQEAESVVLGLKQDLEQAAADLQRIDDNPELVTALRNKVQGLKQQLAEANQVLGQLQSRKQEHLRLSKDIENLTTQFQALDMEIKNYAFWEVGFRELKLNLIDQFLPDFEDRVNSFLSRLRVNLRVSFDTQREKASATKRDHLEGRAFKEEFDVQVFKDDKIPIPYGLLSKGQRGRVGSCVGMALRELTKERGNNLFDFFFLDEVADALDESGLRELVALLEETPGQKLVISHTNFLKDFFQEQVVVEMTNEVSTIVNR